MTGLRVLGLSAILAFACRPATGEVAVPPLKQRVTDTAGALSDARRQGLETTLARFEADKGSQVAVLIVPTTAPESIEQYALRVAEAWKLGRKGVDDGVLLLVAMQDRALRIEVGYGLEGALPDAIAKRIIAEVMTPLFKAGDPTGGIEAGVDRIIRVIAGEPLPPPPRRGASGDTVGPAVGHAPVAVIAAAALGGGLRMAFGRLIGALLGGGMAFVVLLALTGSLAVATVLAVLVLLIILLGSSRHMAGGRGVRSGGLGGGFGGGGFGSGGGFRGGGGSFGGGGASGRW